jgi:hypothetical protein
LVSIRGHLRSERLSPRVWEETLPGARLVAVALNKWQRNEVFRAVQAAGFSPSEFELDVGATETSLRHLPSPSYFIFGGVARRYYSHCKAGEDLFAERDGMSQFRLMEQVEIWLANVKMDTDTPDLWAEFRGDSSLQAALSEEAIANTPFTPKQRDAIVVRMSELKDHVSRTYSLSEAQMRLLSEKLDDLAEASTHMGRKDWRVLVAGAMILYLLEVALPPDAAREVFSLVVRSIGQIVLGGHLGLSSG